MNIRKLLRLAGVLVFASLIVSIARAWIYVSMGGVEFIILVIVLAVIADYFVERKRSKF